MVPPICEYDIVRFFFTADSSLGYHIRINLLSIADGTSTSRETFVLTTEALSVAVSPGHYFVKLVVAALPSGD